ncbi:MAG TPA: hypothetical protein PKY81_00570 [bacterium]|nr:hypothetical protein [bacterium]HPN29426.1 hypothetical protein [bacterium]
MKKYLIFFIIFAIFAASNADAYQIINTTRAGSISAFTGIADDASSVFYNPAGAAFLNNHEIYMFSTDIYKLDVKHNQLLYSLPLFRNFGLIAGYAGANFDDGELSFAQNNFLFNFAGKIFKDISLGFTYKNYNTDADYLSIVKNDGTANSYDAGLLYSKSNFRAGVMFANINNPKIKYSDGVKSDFDDNYIRLGLSYNIGKFLFGTDYDDRKIFYFGGEFRAFPNILHLFGGLKKQFSPNDSARYSFGLRFLAKDFFIDYSNDLNSELGNSYKFALGYKFGFKNFVKLIDSSEPIVFFPSLKNIYSSSSNPFTVFRIVNTADKSISIDIDISDNEFAVSSKKNAFLFKAGEERKICVPINFNDNIFNIRDFVSKQFTVKFYYRINNREYVDYEKIPIVIFNKNSFLWNEPEKIGVFISPKSSPVEKFNSKLTELIKNKSFKLPLPANINKAAVLFNALKLTGLKYEKDVLYPFHGYNDEQKLLDFIQYPAETLELKRGDCDDFSVLFASLFLNAGIDVKLIIQPKHIFIAFNSGIENINEFEYLKNMLINLNGEFYAPIEVSALDKSFIAAWKTGLENIQTSDYRIFDINDIWEKYPPLNLNQPYNPDIPFAEDLIFEFNNEYYEFANVFLNSSAVADDKPDFEIKKIADISIKEKNYFQALNYYMFLYEKNKKNLTYINNIANLFYLTNNYMKSIDFYLMASELDKYNPYYYGQIALLYYKLNENYKAEYYFRMTNSIRPDYFKKYLEAQSYSSR